MSSLVFSRGGVLYNVISDNSVSVGNGTKLYGNALTDETPSILSLPETVVGPDSKVYTVEEISQWSFAFLKAKTEIVIPKTVKRIHENAFDTAGGICNLKFAPYTQLDALPRRMITWSAMKYFEVPPLVKTIGAEAFRGSTSLRRLDYCGHAEFTDTSLFNQTSYSMSIHVAKDYSFSEFSGIPVIKDLVCAWGVAHRFSCRRKSSYFYGCILFSMLFWSSN